eukprot:TRINITY_DN12809_c0_g1_i1.p1 TRINITY_DN12809_c0_g1~~TRINITY_DN12809_c0_g1_i1.p1  ORF type:complete len:393 (+),score=71.98 TRINITY_DN12809_c0_g1_i1:43-1179(+)
MTITASVAAAGAAVVVGCCIKRSISEHRKDPEEAQEKRKESPRGEAVSSNPTHSTLLSDDLGSLGASNLTISGMDASGVLSMSSYQGDSMYSCDENQREEVVKVRSTEFGACSTRVFPEPQEKKDRKYEQLQAYSHLVPLSSVRATRLTSLSEANGHAKTHHIKNIHFLRHGEGTSNSAARIKGCSEYKSNEWLDARLTGLGKKQAGDIASYISKTSIHIDTVIVSPLRRATETGCIAWSARAAECKAPFIACELLRERAHGNPCDQRKSKHILQDEFPGVDYSLISETDPFEITPNKPGESWLDTAHRAKSFLDWLSTKPETDIAVVTHSAFLLTLFNLVLDVQEPALLEWFETGELRSVSLLFPNEMVEQNLKEGK